MARYFRGHIFGDVPRRAGGPNVVGRYCYTHKKALSFVAKTDPCRLMLDEYDQWQAHIQSHQTDHKLCKHPKVD